MTASRLCACGCGRATRLASKTDATRGWTKGEPLAYLHGHGGGSSPLPLSLLIWTRIDVREPDECWPWTGYVGKHGYGSVARGRVHRLVLAEKLGRYLAADEVTRHTCDNRICCNPNHLIVGTNLDNVRDAVERGRTARGERNGRARLTSAAVEEIRRLYATGEFRHVDLAEMFGVARSTIQTVTSGKRWAA